MLVLENVAVTQYVQPVKEVLVLETITVTPNATSGGIFPTANVTLPSNTTFTNSTNSNSSISITSTISTFNYTSTTATGTGVFYFF